MYHSNACNTSNLPQTHIQNQGTDFDLYNIHTSALTSQVQKNFRFNITKYKHSIHELSTNLKLKRSTSSKYFTNQPYFLFFQAIEQIIRER